MDLWECYKSSVFLCHQPLGANLSFAIISARNPEGRLLNLPCNLSLDCQFENWLNRENLPHRRLIGASPDLSFQESSWAVVCDKPKAIDLALVFRQNAIYWIQDGDLYLVPALMDSNEEYLGSYASRQILLRD
jgi:hypothetical protein